MGTRITVSSTKVKRGTNDKGEWVNTQIDTEEGSKWSTFNKGAAELKPGDVIDITEFEEGAGNNRNKITKYTKVSSSPVQTNSAAATASTSSKNSMYDDPVIRRKSIEDQARAYMITDLVNSKIINLEHELSVKLFNWLGKIDGSATSPDKTTTYDEQAGAAHTTKRAIATGDFDNPGQFFAACYQEFGIAQSVVLKELSISRPAEIGDLNEAWSKISTKYRSPFD
jgi:hypothetical protein